MEEIKRKIIKTAIKEFGTKGYELASTNQIHKEALVSKGMIFKLFESKAKLYLNCFETVLNEMIEALESSDVYQIKDPFLKISQVSIWKSAYAMNHPFETTILLEGLNHPPKEVQSDIYSKIDLLSRLSTDHFLEQLELDELSSVYTKEDFIKFMNVALLGLRQYYSQQTITEVNMADYQKEAQSLIEVIMKGMSK